MGQGIRGRTKLEKTITDKTVLHASNLKRRLADLEAELSSVRQQLNELKNQKNPPA